MKKLIVLSLILVITSFIVVSKDSTPLNMEMSFNKNGNPNDTIYVKAPDINSEKYKWEFVKDRLFDGETENVYKIKGSILISLKDASPQDSIIIKEIMQEFRTIIPNKTIDYFKNFVGKPIEFVLKNNYNTLFKGIPVYSLMGSTILMEFDQNPNHSVTTEAQGINTVKVPNDIGNISSSRLFRDEVLNDRNGPYYIFIDINKVLSHEERKKYIQYEFLRSLCFINDANFITEDVIAENDSFQTIFNTAIHKPENSKFTDVDKFLLQKLYSDDFIDQFKDYMYANYPWRYASSFVNKKEHEFKVWGIIIGVGVLAFVLIFSYFQNRKFKYSYLNYLFPVFLILLHFINIVNIYQYLTKFNSVIQWDSHILFQMPFAIVISALISFKLWGLEKISIKGNENFSYQLILKVSYTFISFLVPIILLFMIESDREGLFDFLFPYFLFVLLLAIGRGLLLYLNYFSESLVKEKDVELSRLREAKAEAEVKMLQSQINPHFLYNALNSIASLAHTDANKTEKMALSLSDLFRHSINRKEKKVNTLGDEMYLVRNYLEIEQIRFGDRLKFTIDVESDLLTVEIPMFILQPLVENAIKHGVSKIEDQGEIILKITKKDNGVLISVQDNGPDFPEGLVSGHGLQTVYDLLRFSYGDKASISWHNQPQKEITIYINDIL
jgi:two-component system, LytTR family, sensor kinase